MPSSERTMSNIDPKVLNKIKKCLALAGSDNPNEAATAMRQAHALMEKHGVSSHEITMADIGESTVKSKTMARDKPAQWEARLAAMVGRAFGCQMLVKRMLDKQTKRPVNEGTYIYIGLKHQAEVAAYTTTVLIGKCKRARQAWVAELSAGVPSGVRGMKAKITRMGDAFAEGWVNNISKLVTDFANPAGVDEAIQKHIDQQNAGGCAPTRAIPTDKIGHHERQAAMVGAMAAKDETLHRPMGTKGAQLALGDGRHDGH